MNIPSECRIDNINPNHAMILLHGANPKPDGIFGKDRMLKGEMEFRLGSKQRVCVQGDVIVIPGGTEHEAWFREDTEVIDFFAPPRDDFLLGGKPAYMSEG